MQDEDPHGRRVRFLDALAVLMGCSGSFGDTLPDGRRPDVLRIDLGRNILFMGDAKHVETPGNLASQTRLRRYLVWILSHTRRGGAIGILAICSGKASEGVGWGDVVGILSRDVGLEPRTHGTEQFGRGFVVTWFVYGPSQAPGSTVRGAGAWVLADPLEGAAGAIGE